MKKNKKFWRKRTKTHVLKSRQGNAVNLTNSAKSDVWITADSVVTRWSRIDQRTDRVEDVSLTPRPVTGMCCDKLDFICWRIKHLDIQQ